MPEHPKNVKDDWIMDDTPEQLRDIRRTLDTIATPLNRIADALEKIVELVEKVQAEDEKRADEFAARIKKEKAEARARRLGLHWTAKDAAKFKSNLEKSEKKFLGRNK